MTRYQVDSEAVAAATSSVQAAASRIQSDVSVLHTKLLDLQSSWTGQAAAAFQAVVADWTATQRRVEDSLHLINTGLAQAGQHYADIEQQNARLFAR
ncbi:MAG: WXG100 family type VII secretion target [Pseudolysinimonas sp.]|uniref:WXG100 family type VII secretion target n=1 Tax=Pseudolysinimonas sp. TaxID=2680009 RepID=UPI003266B7EC